MTWRDKLRPRERMRVTNLDDLIEAHLECVANWQKERRAISEKARKRVVRDDV